MLLAVPSSELDKLRIQGSLERYRLAQDIASVYKLGVSKEREVINVRRRMDDASGKDDMELGLEEKQHFPQHKRQLMEEVDYTAVVRLMGCALKVLN